MRRLCVELCGLLLASISVALYYNITFFGKALIALPSFPVAAGCLFYYLAAFNLTPPLAQVLLWLFSFVLSGALWWWMLARIWTIRRFGEVVPGEWSRLRLLPYLYALPVPWLLWVHAQSADGPSWRALIAAVLVRDNLLWSSQGSEVRLNGLFFTLALVETGLSVALLKRSAPWSKVLAVLPLAGLGSAVALCALAQLAFYLH